MQRYAIDKTCPIGRGSFGQVFRAMDRQTVRFVAVKQIIFDPLKDGVPGLGMREISNLKTLSHKRVARLIEAEFSDEGIIHIVMEYADMDLQRFIFITTRNHGGSAMPEPLIQRLSRHLFKGLAHLHANGIIHRDLKPGNILIDRKQSLKIADFGLSRIHSVPCVPTSFEASTLPYRPPEIIMGEFIYSGSYDIWSAGCIIAEIVRAGELLFRGSQPFKSASQLESIFMSLGTPDEEIWPQVNRFPGLRAVPRYEPKPAAELFPGLSVDGMDLILQCLFYPPRYRLSAKRALLHPWLNKHVPAWFPEELAEYYIPEPM